MAEVLVQVLVQVQVAQVVHLLQLQDGQPPLQLLEVDEVLWGPAVVGWQGCQ